MSWDCEFCNARILALAEAESALSAERTARRVMREALEHERARHHECEDDPFETHGCVACPHDTFPCPVSRDLDAALAAEPGEGGPVALGHPRAAEDGGSK